MLVTMIFLFSSHKFVLIVSSRYPSIWQIGTALCRQATTEIRMAQPVWVCLFKSALYHNGRGSTLAAALIQVITCKDFVSQLLCKR